MFDGSWGAFDLFLRRKKKRERGWIHSSTYYWVAWGMPVCLFLVPGRQTKRLQVTVSVEEAKPRDSARWFDGSCYSLLLSWRLVVLLCVLSSQFSSTIIRTQKWRLGWNASRARKTLPPRVIRNAMGVIRLGLCAAGIILFFLLLSQGQIRFCALILDFDENQIFWIEIF